MVRRKAIGFTYIEVMIIIALISFVCVVTTKVIQHNLEQKIPLYVYNLYKNLDTESKLLTKRFLTEDENGLNGSSSPSASSSGIGNKTIEEILKKVDAKTYCKAFAKDINLVGEVDCENSVEDEEAGFSENRSIQYDCSRSYSFRVNDDGSYLETLTPIYNSNLSQCLNNENFSDKTISCNAKPTIAINALLKKNTEGNYTYSCKKSEETDEDGADEAETEKSQFSLDSKPKTGKALQTTNNVYLKFVTLKPSDGKYTLKYNLLANIGQDEIMPTHSFDTPISCGCRPQSDKDGDCIKVFNWQVNDDCCQWFWDGQKKRWGSLWRTLDNWSVTPSFENNKCTFKVITKTCALDAKTDVIQKPKSYSKEIELMQEFQIGDPLAYARERQENDYKIDENSLVVTNVIIQKKYKDISGRNRNPIVSKLDIRQVAYNFNDNKEFYRKYYTKWNSFFTNNNFAKVTKDAINLQEVNEGSLEKTIENASSETTNLNEYLAHFIYAAIDIPFSKGQMNKNIFVFEQFGNNIIPVGYLANNPNTPLKFDVVTRGTNTLNIKKLNQKPLTFCEAMQYTGDKFSKYCSCKNLSGSVVTQYPKSSVCDNNFGCLIKPVQPSNVAPKFKLF